jgi:hypothetical protein
LLLRFLLRCPRLFLGEKSPRRVLAFKVGSRLAGSK